MGLFGGGALRKENAALKDELEALRAELATAKSAKADAEKRLADKDDEAKKARETARKSDRKLDKIKDARRSADEKAASMQGKVDHLESELADFRRAMLQSKEEADIARARVAELEGQLTTARRIVDARPATPAPAVKTDEAPAEAPPPRRRDDDPRLERLREQLSAEREANKALRDKVADAEKQARIADRRRVSDLDKNESAVRDLQHHLRAERRAYKILQLQFEAQRERARGAEQAVAARVEAELARVESLAPRAGATEPAPAPEVEPAVDAPADDAASDDAASSSPVGEGAPQS